MSHNVTIKCFCDCGGVYVYDHTETYHDIFTMRDVTRYVHKCDKCGQIEYMGDIFPKNMNNVKDVKF